MSYTPIPNLYSDQTVLLFREVFVLEKIHGTSARVEWRNGSVRLSSGGAKHAAFVALFDTAALSERFVAFGHPEIVVYGEACGGSVQKMSHTYGPNLRFVAFEVKVGDTWLAVPNAADVAAKLGLDFVPWTLCSTDLAALDALRDKPSEFAVRCGITEPRPREGIVLRPLREFTTSNGARVMAKHKGAAFSETATPREVDPAKQKIINDANTAAAEWATPRRLEHVLDALTVDGVAPGIKRTRDVITAMLADVRKECGAEIVWSREVERAIGSTTARLFKEHLAGALGEHHDET